MENKEVHLLDYLNILNKHRKFIIIFTLTLTFLVVIISLLMPFTYRSTAVIMPPFNKTGSGILGNLGNLGNVPFFDFGLNDNQAEINIYISILESRNVMEKIVNKYKLVERYQAKNLEEAVRYLREDTAFDFNDEGTLEINVDVSTGWLPDLKSKEEAAQLAADIANTFLVRLDEVYRQMKTEQAKNHREFIENRYLQNLKDLEKAENDFKAFQEKTGIVALPEQLSATIKTAAEIQAQIISNEVKYGAIKKAYGENYPELRKLEITTLELKKKLADLDITGKSTVESNTNSDSKFSKSPVLGMEFLRLERELEVQTEIFKFLTQQYEDAKIQEAKNTPTIQILDNAVKSERKYKPKRSIIIIAFFLLSLGVSFFITFFLEYMRKSKV